MTFLLTARQYHICINFTEGMALSASFVLCKITQNGSTYPLHSQCLCPITWGILLIITANQVNITAYNKSGLLENPDITA